MGISTDLIKELEKIDGLTCMLNDIYRANVDIENVVYEDKFPVCICYLLKDGSFTYKNGILKQERGFDILFLDKDNLDFDSITNDYIIDNMGKYAIEFIKVLEKSNLFESIYDLDYDIVKNIFDLNLSGIVLANVRIKQSQGICIS